MKSRNSIIKTVVLLKNLKELKPKLMSHNVNRVLVEVIDEA